jgi:hypothetical protein
VIVEATRASLALRAGVEDAWNELERLTVGSLTKNAAGRGPFGARPAGGHPPGRFSLTFEQCPCRWRDLLAEAADQVRVVAHQEEGVDSPVDRQVSECVRPGEVGPEVEHPADIGKIPACFARRVVDALLPSSIASSDGR